MVGGSNHPTLGVRQLRKWAYLEAMVVCGIVACVAAGRLAFIRA
jgi:hypothetical protein